MGVLLRDFMGKFGTMTGGAKSDQPTGDPKGFFAGLSEEQKVAALAYRGEEFIACYDLPTAEELARIDPELEAFYAKSKLVR